MSPQPVPIHRRVRADELLQTMAALLLEYAGAHEEWEVFSRIKLAEGGSLAKYYPLNDEGWAEYEEWKRHSSRSAMEST